MRIAPVALVVTDVSRLSCLLYTTRATQHVRLFPISKCMGQIAS